jgi:ribosomal protein S18 acetylase RimI-like enzyme
VQSELARIEAFTRWVEDRTSTSTTPWRLGTALYHEGFPTYYAHNFLRVERPLGTATAPDLAAEADRLLVGYEHRRIAVGDDEDGHRLAPGFTELGWQAERHVVQLRTREPDRPPPAGAREVKIDELMPFRRETWRRTQGEATVPLAEFGHELVTRIGARFFAASVDGAIASACDLYLHDGVAQVEMVDTLEEHRGQGLARAVVVAAAEAARTSGSELVFIVADDDDWPKELYRRLGFDDVAHGWEFLLPPHAGSSEQPTD